MPAAVPAWRSPALPIRIGISSCLLGEAVRYDGGHQRDDYLTGVLGRYVTWVPVCPEMEVGLGVPREPIRLVGDAAAPRLLGVSSGADHTERMNDFARRRVRELARHGLSGYVLKRGSPSCGLAGVKLYRDEHAAPERAGVGLFARVLRKTLPLLPIEQEDRLGDPRRRGLPTHQAESQHRLGENVPDAHPWVQRAERVLEHHLDVPAQLTQPISPEIGDVVAVEGDVAARDVEQPQCQPPKRGLARSRLADQPDGFAGTYIQRGIVNRAQDGLSLPRKSFADSEVSGHIGELEQRRALGAAEFRSHQGVLTGSRAP